MMNFQKTDALGGLLEGIQARQREENNILTQQNTMQQMQRAALEAQIMQQKAPHEIEGLRLGQISRENASRYIQDMIQFGDTPGAEDFLEQKYGVKGHPVTQAFKAAKKRGEDAAMMSDQIDPLMYVRQIQERLALSDDKSRQATATAEAQMKKQESINEANYKREQLRQTEATKRAEIQAQAKQAVGRLMSAAQSIKNKSLNQYAAELLEEAEAAARTGDEATMLQKRQQANDVVLMLQAIAAAPGNAQRADEAQKLYAFTNGRIDLRGQVGAQPGAGPGGGGGQGAGANGDDPRISQALGRQGKRYEPDKYDYKITPDGKILQRPKGGAPAPAAAPAAPAAGGAATKQWWDE